MDKLAARELREQQKRIRPGECQKYVRLVLDEQLIQQRHFGSRLQKVLEQKGLNYCVRPLDHPNVIFWERQQFNSSGGRDGLDDWKREDHIISVLTHDELLTLYDGKSLGELCQNLTKSYPNGYFVILLLHPPKSSLEVAGALFELQIVHHLNVIQVPLTNDLMAMLEELKRLTKSVAEIPFKQQKEAAVSRFRKYLLNDNRQCVRVEGTNGFKRLWIQQLTRFPKVSFAVANTIVEEYSCPKKLIDAFQTSPTETIQKISNLPVNRGSDAEGQQVNSRRIGNAIAQKLHTFFTATDPNTLI